MTEPAIYIHAAAALGPHGDTTAAERVRLQADPPPLELRELVKRVVGVSLRQASHLVELACVASQLCLRRLPVAAPENTAVYLGTGLAEVRKTGALFRQVMPPGPGMASPFDFINAANNMAAFYVARLGNFRARNLTVTQEEFSFEWALQLALADLRAGRYRWALVGGVDENSQPRADHLRRIALRDQQFLGEGAGFLVLSGEPDRARAELLGVRHLPNTTIDAALAHALALWRHADEPVTVLPGFRLDRIDVAAMAALPGVTPHPYLDRCGGFHTAAAFGVGALFDPPGPPAGLAVHVNRNSDGHFMLVGIRGIAGDPAT